MTADLDALRRHLNDAHAALEAASRSAQAVRGDQLPDFATQIVIDQIHDAGIVVSIATAATQHGRTDPPAKANPRQPTPDTACVCGCGRPDDDTDMCHCPTPCPCEPDCTFCLVPNPMQEHAPGGEAL